MRLNNENIDIIRGKILLLLTKSDELQNDAIRLKSNHNYINGWDFPEFEKNLEMRSEVFDEIYRILNSDNLTEIESDKLFSELNIIDKDKIFITDCHNWTNKKMNHLENSIKSKKKVKKYDNTWPNIAESEEDRIMRRLREGNGDLEGF